MEKPNQAELEAARAASEKAAAEQKKQDTKPSENASTDELPPAKPSIEERLKGLEEAAVANQKQLTNISSMLSAITSLSTPAPAVGVSPTAEVMPGAENSPPAPAAGGNGAAAQPNPLLMMLFQKMMGGGGSELTALEKLAYKSLESDISLKTTIISTLLRKGMRTAPMFEQTPDAGGYHE